MQQVRQLLPEFAELLDERRNDEQADPDERADNRGVDEEDCRPAWQPLPTGTALLERLHQWREPHRDEQADVDDEERVPDEERGPQEDRRQRQADERIADERACLVYLAVAAVTHVPGIAS